MEKKIIGKSLFARHKKTKHRERIIETLNLFETPATAEEILEMFNYWKEKISLSTIYRNLELLTREGVANKSMVMDDNKARYELNRQKNRHYIVCVKCHKIEQLDFFPLKNKEQELKQKTNYKITGYKFEIYGYCPDCKD